MARKSRPRGGAAPARAAAPKAAGNAAVGSRPTGTAQLTAPAPTNRDAAAANPDPAATNPHPADPKRPAYPGQGFGLPERGPGSVSDMGRRALALIIDWLLCMVIAYWLTHSQFWTIAVFAVEDYVFTALTGLTVGKRLLGIRVIRTSGGMVGFRWALVRTAVLLTVVPALLTDRDLRGLHDRASDTVVVRI